MFNKILGVLNNLFIVQDLQVKGSGMSGVVGKHVVRSQGLTLKLIFLISPKYGPHI